ncbi:MAG: SpoIIE family protein phosphatase [bacterium]|nr:SpoIIE family protein phosphatase [bacterium]
MEFFDSLQINFFSIAALIPTCFDIFLAYLFLVTIKKKSKATFHLGMAYIFVAIFNFAYFIAAGFYDSGAAYHRWLTVGVILITETHINMFLYHLHENKYPRFARGFLIAQYVVAFLVTGYFIYSTIGSDKIFHFRGDYWDFDLDGASIIVGRVVQVYVLIAIAITIWKFATIKSKKRWNVIFLSLTYLIVSAAPSVLNIISRTGSMDRGMFQVSWDLLNILGFFLLSIVYINTTKDKTSFITKIISISLVSLLLVLQGLTYYSFRDKEEAYDAIHLAYATHYLEHHGDSHAKYITSYSFNEKKEDRLKLLQSKSGTSIVVDPREIEPSYRNTIIREKIKKLGSGNVSGKPGQKTRQDDISYEEQLAKLLTMTHSFFEGYKRYIARELGLLPDGKYNRSKKILESIDSIERRLFHYRREIKKLPNDTFRSALVRLLGERKTRLQPFSEAIKDHIKESAKQGVKLKQEVLQFLVPMTSSGARHYREYGDTHYISYLDVDLEKNVIYEVGFSYLEYRQGLHQSGKRFTLILLAILVLVVAGFPLFFKETLIGPLTKLQKSFLKVWESGETDVELPIKVMDEIGFLTHNFNMMARTISSGKRELDKHARELEEKVKERTEKLLNILMEVQELKEQQDGDYFLTSLLLEPLGQNQAECENLSIEFFIKEKKQFQFRKWKKEIGGDICCSQNVYLKGKQYAAFVNGDAMGKSIQGAGGALVLGAAFKAILDRTMFSVKEQEKHPEHWLKSSYIELQRIFESFDGSMLISLVIGLVDDETGLVYYLNAEHPWTTLYRNGKASFIEKEFLLRKLGIQITNEVVTIKIFQLEPGDIVIAGSDGRDDIVVKDEDGLEQINEDETLFLKMVERGEGSLVQIYESIIAAGNLTDDLSLLRLAYKEGVPEEEGEQNLEEILSLLKMYKDPDEPAGVPDEESNRLENLEKACTINRYNHVLLKELLQLLISKENYLKAVFYIEEYIELKPEDTEFIFTASTCFMKIDDYKKAIELAERVHLRNPREMRYLAHLARLNMLANNYIEGEEYLEKMLLIDPDHPEVPEIRELRRR